MGGAIGGVAATVFSTSRATLKVNTIIKDEELTKKEKIQRSVKPVLPAAASVIFALAGIAAMYKFGKKKQAALLGLLVSTQQVFQQYRNNTRKEIGSVEEGCLYSETVANTKGYDKNVPDIPKTDDEEVFCESVSGQFFTAKPKDIYEAAYNINRQFAYRGEVEFNDWLELLKLDDEEMLYGFGWCQDQGFEFYGYQFIEIDIQPRNKNGKQYKLITYPFLPHNIDIDADDVDLDTAVILNPSIDTDLWKKMSDEEKKSMMNDQMAAICN
jgi:hypothetical protein